MWGDIVALIWGIEYSNNKYMKKYIVALDGHRLIIFKATTNQKQVSATEGTIERVCAGQEAQGECDTIILGVV